MNIPFNTPGRRGATIAIASLLAVVYVGLSATQFLASLFGQRVELSSLKKAAWLDPGNAEYREHLGRYYDLVARDPTLAIGEYKAAVQLNPHSARYWFDLASSYQILGDTTNQTVALERAIEADATTPDVAWEAANLYLVQGQNEKALKEFRVVIANDPPLAPAALQFCWRIQPDVDSLLRYVVPPQAEALTSFLALLESKEETSGALKAWDVLIGTKEKFEEPHAFEFIRYLVQHKQVDAAIRVWRETAVRFALTSYLPSSSNLIVNGNFDFKVLNAGFDWQYQKQSTVNLMLDPSDFHAGRRSLLITFDGPSISDAGIYQFVAVEPNKQYSFTGYYKTGEMEGAGGPHFTIQDMYTQTVYYESEELKDAGFWKSASGEFTSGPDCKLVMLHIRRLPSGSPIRGKLWVGDFHLAEKPS